MGAVKKKEGFADAFRRATKRSGRRIKLPRFDLSEIEDYYTYYVQIMGVPEATFWHASIPLLQKIVDNKAAYDSWHSSVIEAEREARKHG